MQKQDKNTNEEFIVEDDGSISVRPIRPHEMRALTSKTGQASDRTQMAMNAALNILKLTDEDLSREGLKSTPLRFAKAFHHLFQGYEGSPQSVVGEGIFPSEGRGLVSVEAVEFYSLCEHHLLPFWGKATVAYFPRDKILGLSKIPRLVDLFSRRVQVQERITQQVCDAIDELISPRAIFVQLEAQHLCMMMRGVEKQASLTKTQIVKNFDTLLEYEKQQFSKLMT